MAMTRAPLSDLLKLIAALGGVHLRGRSAVFLVDSDSKTLRYGASSGLDAGYIEAIEGFEIGPHSPSCGTAAYSGDMVIVGDVASDQLWAPFLKLAIEHGIAACWSKPITDSRGIIVGTYAVYHRDNRLPTPSDMEIIELLASTTGILIERSVADSTLQSTIDELRRSELATREVSHRVMNTFQILEGILSVKIRAINEPTARKITTDALERIRSMSLVHQKLFAISQSLQAELDVTAFLIEIIEIFGQVFIEDNNIKLAMDHSESITTSSEMCASLALLMIELILNAIKHAFHDDQKNGRIYVSLTREKNIATIKVSDNGKGLPEGKLSNKPNRLGAKLIESFVQDIKGHLSYKNLPAGSEFSVSFPLNG